MKRTFAERLKVLLAQKKMTQTELARLLLELETPDKVEALLQSKKSTISRWLSGSIKCPDLQNIEHLSLVLNVNEKYFLGKMNMPLPLTFDECSNNEINSARARLFLFQYISEYLNFDVEAEVNSLGGASLNTAFKEYTNGNELYFYSLEREIGAYITARLEALGIPKREV